MELNQLTTAAGMKGRKAEKAIENFMWNLSLIKTEMDILNAVKDDSECSLKQVQICTNYQHMNYQESVDCNLFSYFMKSI